MTRVVEGYLADLEAGRATDPERLIAENHSIAEPLRACLETLRFVEQAAGSLVSAPAAPPIAVLGDYRIIREIGRGGMGVVYEAEQTSLGRRVALKVLPFAAVLDPRQLQRFKNEAQAAAQLHHTSIVPVFSVGCERGVHYYAMQYIDGQTLAALIRDLRQSRALDEGPGRRGEASPMPPLSSIQSPAGSPPRTPAAARDFFRSMANLGLQAAKALEHAHELGVIHRDIKPSNLLLDVRRNLWITDFGLARFEKDAGLTMSGDLIGTLAYMSPEQALAKRVQVDHRTDIYSLGVTLYELLTLELPFKGRDREELLRQIAFDDPAPPRRIDRQIPFELETIVLKATAKSPEARYATAGALAEDLERFLGDKPVLARRPTLLERGRKWCRRHRALVTASAVLLAMAVIGLAAFTVVLSGEQGRTRAALFRAEKNFLKAREVVDGMLTWVSEDPLAKAPHMENVRKSLLERALQFYLGFLEEKGEDPAIRGETARAYGRLGEIRELLGEFAESEKAYRRSLEIRRGLVEDDPETLEQHFQLGRAHAALGHLLSRTGQPDEAQSELETAVNIAEKLRSLHPGDASARYELSRSCAELATHLRATSRYEAASETCEKSVRLLKEVESLGPASLKVRRSLAEAYGNLGLCLGDTGRTKEAENAYREALERYRKLEGELPEPVLAHREASVLYSLAVLLEAGGKKEAAAESLEGAGVRLRKLVAEFPSVIDYRFLLSCACNVLGNLHSSAGRPEAAEKSYREALALEEKLVADCGKVPRYRRELARGYNNLGIVLQDSLQRPEEAKELYSKARDLYRDLAEEFKDVSDYKEGLAQSYNNLGDLLRASGKLDESIDAFSRAREIFRSIAEASPSNPGFQRCCAMASGNLAHPYLLKGDIGTSRRILEEGIDGLLRAMRSQPLEPQYRGAELGIHGALAEVLSLQGDHRELARRAEDLLGLSPSDPTRSYMASVFLASALEAAEKDESLAPAERGPAAAGYRARAFQALARAVEEGFQDVATLTDSPELNALRGEEEFERILKRARAAAEKEESPEESKEEGKK